MGLSGTASGSADDEGGTLDQALSIPPNGTRVSIETTIALAGEILSARVPNFATGTLNGPVTFSRNGVVSTCPAGAVLWALNRMP